jgi:hypothetical protein
MLSADTEVLSKDGWVKVSEVTETRPILQAWPISGGTVELEWSRASVSAQAGLSQFALCEAETVTFRATTDHTMLVVAPDGRWIEGTLSSLRNFHRLPAAGLLRAGDHLDERGRLVLAVALATQADGSFTEAGAIDFGFQKVRKVERLKSLLKQANISFRYTHQEAKGRHRFIIPPPQAIKIKALLTKDKQLLWNLLQLAPPERDGVLEEIVHWDSSVEDGGFRFSTAHFHNAEIVLALAAIGGRRARLSADREWWRVRVTTASAHDLQKVKVTLSEAEGQVFKILNSSGYILARQGGTTLITRGW